MVNLLKSRLIKKKNIINFITVAIELAVLIFLLHWRFRMGILKFFDADEMAYLHWGYNMSLGERPYTDFMFLLPPLFLYTLVPFYYFIGRTIATILAIRIFIFVIFIGTTLFLMLIAWRIRDLKTALLAGIVFAMMPIPSDKMVEIRPDLVAVFFALAGMYLLMLSTEFKNKFLLSLSAGFYTISLCYIPKTVFYLIPPVIVLWFEGLKVAAKGKLNNIIKDKYLPAIIGFLIPAIAIGIIIVSYGNLNMAFYSMTRFASDIHKTLGYKFYMAPTLFFYPNDTYYGYPGMDNWPYIFTRILYPLAGIWAIKNLISAFSHKNSSRCIAEFLISATFFLNLYAFVKFYPLKHSQYMISFAPFIAFYFADFFYSLSRVGFLKGRFLIFGNILFIVVAIFSGYVGNLVNNIKINWTNLPALSRIEADIKNIPADTRVFDLTGGSVFFRHAYYFCCLPYGQFEEIIRFPIPNLETAMAANNSKVIHTDFYDRIGILPAIQQLYIKDNFVPYLPNYPDGSWLIKKN